MKKAIGITALVLVAAVTLTICFGVAIGSTEVREYMKTGSSGFSRAVERLGNHDTYDWAVAEQSQYLRETKSMDSTSLTDKTQLSIYASVSTVYITNSSDNDVHVKADIYSSTPNYNRDHYSLSSNDKYDISLNVDDTLNEDSIAVLTVSIPQSVKSIDFVSDVGDVKIDNLSLESLKTKLSVGTLTIKNSTVADIEVSVDTGSVELSDSFTYTESLKVTNNVGSVSMSLPKNRSFELSYKTSMGGLDIDDDVDLSACTFTDENGNATGGISSNGKITYRQSDAGAKEPVTITLDASVGTISID